jgi:late competence protein required for DNA uptake (superfamily II DNA/RNA helicase)
MAPRGRTPSLIGSSAGASKVATAKGKRTCRRCKAKIHSPSKCVEVGVPGTMGHRTYCGSCFKNILVQSKQDLAKLEALVASI